MKQGNTEKQTKLLSPNFTLEEMCRSKTAATRFILNEPSDPVVLENLKRLAERVLQPLRDHVGKPLIVNSGYRTVALNNYLKGAKNSYHVYGCAADLKMDNWEMAYDCASFVTRELPFNEVIISKRDSSIWLHVAYRMGDTKRYVGFWEYRSE